MSSPSLYLVLWILQPALQGTIAAIMFRRRLHKDFSVFFAYLLAQIAIFCIGFPLYHLAYYPVYFWAFCILTSVDLVFNFKILHEIFLDIFRPYDALRDLGNALFKWGALVMILLSIVLVSSTPGGGDPVERTLLVVQRSVRLIQCGMLVFLLAFCRYLGVSRKRHSFGLTLGFGILASAELIINALFSGGHFHVNVANLANAAAADFGMMVWLVYFVWNQRPVVATALIPQRWDEALTELRPQIDSEALIPMFETMVDRALSKAQNTRV